MRSPSEKSLLLKKFKRLYPDPKSELDFRNPFELCVAVSLSAQCTDKKVNQVTPVLFKKYSNSEALARAKLKDVEEIIRPINYYRTKSKNLIEMAKLVVEHHAGKIPTVRAELMKLPGVGNKTANVILGELGIEATIPVDTHVFRVAQRLGLASGKTPEQIEEQLKDAFDKKHWRSLHHWLIFHGRRVCKAQRPLCQSCELAQLCPSRVE